MDKEYFKNQNMRNITPKSRDEKIYRIIPFSRLVQMLEDKKNTLVKTSFWEDPYENFFYKQHFRTNDGTLVDATNLGEQIFGQCWSLFKDSDALWRIYSQDKQSVRIKTTIGKLYDSAYLEEACMASTFIGKINYKSNKNLKKWLIENNPISIFELDKVATESMFYKRNNFSHEKEIRLIYRIDSDSPEKLNNIKQYDIDISDFIEEITFDPRCDDSYYEKSKNYLINKYKINSEKINKSQLYTFRQIEIQFKD